MQTTYQLTLWTFTFYTAPVYKVFVFIQWPLYTCLILSSPIQQPFHIIHLYEAHNVLFFVTLLEMCKLCVSIEVITKGGIEPNYIYEFFFVSFPLT